MSGRVPGESWRALEGLGSSGRVLGGPAESGSLGFREGPGESGKGSGRVLEGLGKVLGGVLGKVLGGVLGGSRMVRARSDPKTHFCEEVVKEKGIFFEGAPGEVRERSRMDPRGIQEARMHSSRYIKKVL